MIKRAFLVFVLVTLLSSNLVATDKVDLYGSTDLSFIQSFFTPHIYASVNIGATLERDLAVEIPVGLYFDNSGGSEILLDTSINLLIYPWESGPYISLSLINLIVFLGEYRPHESIHYLHKMGFGYRIVINERFALSPQLIIVDPSQMYQESLSYIQGFIPSYGKLAFSLFCQYTFCTLSIEE